MDIAIVDYGSGNLRSAQKAFERAGNDSGLDARIELTSDPERILNADRIVLPGVGAFADCRSGLDGVSGLVEALNEAVITKARPFLGICVGMQLMAETGKEKVVTDGLGWIGGEVVIMQPEDPSLKIPQIGWNTLHAERDHPILDDIPVGNDGLHAYFVHSYQMKCRNAADRIATTSYGGPVTAIIGRDNMVGTQFHPEKSQTLGLRLIANFLMWSP